MHRTIDGIVLDLDIHRRSKTHKSKQVREVVHDSSRSRNSSIQGTAPTGHMQGKPRLRLQRPSIISQPTQARATLSWILPSSTAFLFGIGYGSHQVGQRDILHTWRNQAAQRILASTIVICTCWLLQEAVSASRPRSAKGAWLSCAAQPLTSRLTASSRGWQSAIVVVHTMIDI